MKKKLLLFIVLPSYSLIAQVGIGTITPDPDAVLDLTSTTGGLLLPRLSLTSTTLATPMSTHVAGMMVYNMSAVGGGSTGVYPGVYFNTGTSWVRYQEANIGDIKYSFCPSDHNGWYLLDGRNLTSLTPDVQLRVSTLCWVGTLPDATGRYLKGKMGAEIPGAIGGNNSISISQANLPNVNLTGTTSTTGAHTHSFTDHGDDSVQASLLGIGLGAVTGVSSSPYVTGSSGNHAHTVSVGTGGSNTPITIQPAYVAANIFVYLGK